MKGFLEHGRPADWCSQKNCSLQFYHMIETENVNKQNMDPKQQLSTLDVLTKKLTQGNCAIHLYY